VNPERTSARALQWDAGGVRKFLQHTSVRPIAHGFCRWLNWATCIAGCMVLLRCVPWLLLLAAARQQQYAARNVGKQRPCPFVRMSSYQLCFLTPGSIPSFAKVLNMILLIL